MIKKLLYWLSKHIVFLCSAVLLLFLGLYLGLRFYLLPNIHEHKDAIAQRISIAARQKVTIGDIRAAWDHLHPVLALAQITVYDAQNRPALQFDHISTELSWKSIASLEPKLNKLIIYAPQLTIRRENNGEIFVAGISMSEKSNPDLTNWLLRQGRIEIEDASVIWQDDFRQATPLTLNHLNFQLDRPILSQLTGQHAFKLVASPSIGTTHPVRIDGVFYGNDVSKALEWHGELKAQLEEADLSIWKQWIDYPFDLQKGFGTAKLGFHFVDKHIDRLSADLAIKNISATIKPNQQAIALDQLSGQLVFVSTKNTTLFEAKKIKLNGPNNLNIQNAYARYARKNNTSKPNTEGSIKFDSIRLDTLRALMNELPIPNEKLQQLNALAPTGILQQFFLSWDGVDSRPEHYKLQSTFNEVSLKATDKIPGVSNFSGNVSATEDGGTLKLDTKQAVLDMKGILRWPIPIDTLSGTIDWNITNKEINISSKDLSLSNPHLAGKTTVHYVHHTTGSDYIDMEGEFGKGNAKFAHFYYPLILGAPTLHWLDTSVLAGKAEDIKVIIKGKLEDFPFTNKQHQVDKNLGIFRVTANLSHALLEYGTGWPVIEGLDVNLLFEGKRMLLNTTQGHLFGNRIIKSKTEIPRLDAESPMLHITSELEGSVSEGIKFVNQSPVKEVTMGFTDTLKANGNGKLWLELNIPMQNLDAAKYKGIYQVSNGTIFADKATGIPKLDNINGKLNFTENSLSARGINTQLFGDTTQIDLTADSEKIIRINAKGRLTNQGLKQLAGNTIANHISGGTDWQANIIIKKPQIELNLTSNLVGLGINFPDPLNKTATTSLPLRIEKKHDFIQVNAANLINIKLLQGKSDLGLNIDRGEIAFNTTAHLPTAKGISIIGKLDNLDLDQWRNLLSAQKEQGTTANNDLEIQNVNMDIGVLKVFDKEIHTLKLNAQTSITGWKSNIKSNEAIGDVEWLNTNNGKIIARLDKLIIPASSNNITNTNLAPPEKMEVKSYPALDVIAQQFEIGQKNWGKMELVAFPNGDDWTIQKLNISNPNHTLTAEGTWHQWIRNPFTRLQFKWSINNVGKTLKSLGQPDTIKSGEAEVDGQLRWNGSPHQFESKGLDGNFVLDAKKGQIIKVQPGVGRLFGLLSLQSLPRRLTLDFRDLFSEGFAFDKITANAHIKNGIMRSDDFYMTGPAAEVAIKGEIDLQKETQNLHVKIAPHVSDSASLAAFAGGPIVGVAAFIAQKLLKDPLNKIASTEYQIIGTWDSPKEINVESTKNNQDNSVNPLK